MDGQGVVGNGGRRAGGVMGKGGQTGQEAGWVVGEEVDGVGVGDLFSGVGLLGWMP